MVKLLQVVVPYLGNITGGRTTPDVTGRALKGVLFDISHLGLSCQVRYYRYCCQQQLESLLKRRSLVRSQVYATGLIAHTPTPYIATYQVPGDKS